MDAHASLTKRSERPLSRKFGDISIQSGHESESLFKLGQETIPLIAIYQNYMLNSGNDKGSKNILFTNVDK